MKYVSEYLIKIISAAMLLSIISHIFREKGTVHALIKMLSGVYLAIVIISPITKLSINEDFLSLDTFYQSAFQYCNDGEQLADNQNRQFIKSKAESYIMDKAVSMNTDLSVEVVLAKEGNNPYESIVLKGDTSPYVKEQLSKTIVNDLGISVEAQRWIN